MSNFAALRHQLESIKLSNKAQQDYTQPDERPRCKSCENISNSNAAIPKCHLPQRGGFSVSPWGMCDFYKAKAKQ